MNEPTHHTPMDSANDLADYIERCVKDDAPIHLTKLERLRIADSLRIANQAPSEKRSIQYERRPELDKRIANGDDFAGDAYVRWVVPGQQPEDMA